MNSIFKRKNRKKTPLKAVTVLQKTLKPLSVNVKMKLNPEDKLDRQSMNVESCSRRTPEQNLAVNIGTTLSLDFYVSSLGMEGLSDMTWGDAWCNGLHVCFPSLPPVLLYGFVSRLGFDFWGFSMWHFLKLVARDFLRIIRFPPLLHRLMVQPII